MENADSVDHRGVRLTDEEKEWLRAALEAARSNEVSDAFEFLRELEDGEQNQVREEIRRDGR